MARKPGLPPGARVFSTASRGASATSSARTMRTPSKVTCSAGMWKPIRGTITSPTGVPSAAGEETLASTPAIAPSRRSPATSNSLRPSQRPIRNPVAASSPASSRTSTKASRRRSSAVWRLMNSPVRGEYWYIGSGPSPPVGSRSNGSSAPCASSSSNRSDAVTARRRRAASRRSVVLSSVVTHPEFHRARTRPAPAGLLAGRRRRRAGRHQRLERRGEVARTGVRPLDGKPALAVGAHVLDQRDQRAALVRQRILDAWRNLRIGLALHDSQLLQCAQPQRERPRADALEGALELTEAKRGVGQIPDDQECPLPGDHLGRAAHGALAVH